MRSVALKCRPLLMSAALLSAFLVMLLQAIVPQVALATPPPVDQQAPWTGPDPTWGPPPPHALTSLAVAIGEDDPPDYSNPDGLSTGPCSLLPRHYNVKQYGAVAIHGTMPLRCGYFNGTKGFGFAKLSAKGRWDPWWDGMIGATLQNPQGGVVQDGTSFKYRTRWFYECTPVYRFIVVTDVRPYGPGRMGIITAYQQWQ